MFRGALSVFAAVIFGSYGWFWCGAGNCIACGAAVVSIEPRSEVCRQCSLSPAILADRRDSFDRTIRPRIREVRELPGGFALRFESTDMIVTDLAAWIDQERTCCAFLEFRLVVKRNLGHVWLEAEGDATAKRFLQEALHLTAESN